MRFNGTEPFMCILLLDIYTHVYMYIGIYTVPWRVRKSGAYLPLPVWRKTPYWLYVCQGTLCLGFALAISGLWRKTDTPGPVLSEIGAPPFRRWLAHPSTQHNDHSCCCLFIRLVHLIWGWGGSLAADSIAVLSLCSFPLLPSLLVPLSTVYHNLL